MRATYSTAPVKCTSVIHPIRWPGPASIWPSDSHARTHTTIDIRHTWHASARPYELTLLRSLLIFIVSFGAQSKPMQIKLAHCIQTTSRASHAQHVSPGGGPDAGSVGVDGALAVPLDVVTNVMLAERTAWPEKCNVASELVHYPADLSTKPSGA